MDKTQTSGPFGGDDRYRSVGSDPRSLRPKAANRGAALAVIAAILIAIVLIAIASL